MDTDFQPTTVYQPRNTRTTRTSRVGQPPSAVESTGNWEPTAENCWSTAPGTKITSRQSLPSTGSRDAKNAKLRRTEDARRPIEPASPKETTERCRTAALACRTNWQRRTANVVTPDLDPGRELRIYRLRPTGYRLPPASDEPRGPGDGFRHRERQGRPSPPSFHRSSIPILRARGPKAPRRTRPRPPSPKRLAPPLNQTPSL